MPSFETPTDAAKQFSVFFRKVSDIRGKVDNYEDDLSQTLHNKTVLPLNDKAHFNVSETNSTKLKIISGSPKQKSLELIPTRVTQITS